MLGSRDDVSKRAGIGNKLLQLPEALPTVTTASYRLGNSVRTLTSAAAYSDRGEVKGWSVFNERNAALADFANSGGARFVNLNAMNAGGLASKLEAGASYDESSAGK